jgi:hypothetical protein
MAAFPAAIVVSAHVGMTFITCERRFVTTGLRGDGAGDSMVPS